MNDRFKFRVWDKSLEKYMEFKEFKFMNVEFTFNPTTKEAEIEYDKERYIVEQCTGLKDKNGKLIYENDYVKYNGNTYKVFWNKTKISLENILNNDIIDIQEFDYMEIIGNEHENGNIKKI